MCGDFTWRVSDCEEIEEVTHRGMMGDGRLLRVGDSRETFWCSSGSCSPRGSFRRGVDDS